MEHVLLDDVIHTDYGQFDLVWSDEAGFDGDWDRFFTGQVNGLVGAADAGGVDVNLGRRSGGSLLRLVLLDAEPPLPPARYEDVVEVSITVPVGADVRWLSWARETFGALRAWRLGRIDCESARTAETPDVKASSPWVWSTSTCWSCGPQR